MPANTVKALFLIGFISLLGSGIAPGAAEHKPAAEDHKPASSIPSANLIEPADFAAELQKASQPKPLILHVGFRKLYDQAHIPNSEYAGPANEDDGLKGLSERVARLPKDSAIVIYCGCCPWTKCPNVAAAFDQLRALGFTQVRVLHIVKDFGTNWVDEGYPAVPGS